MPAVQPDTAAATAEVAPVVPAQTTPAQTAAEPAATEPAAVVAAPKPASAPIVVGEAALNAVVQAAGLTWVQTDPARQAQSQAQSAADQAPARLGRERKPVAQASSAPLVQVETAR
ncbi:hypothetical protein L573_2010 [Bordetella holmesii H620]|nr:hypothetical protein L573_2010 [Bordetella holmesii H620]